MLGEANLLDFRTAAILSAWRHLTRGQSGRTTPGGPCPPPPPWAGQAARVKKGDVVLDPEQTSATRNHCSAANGCSERWGL